MVCNAIVYNLFEKALTQISYWFNNVQCFCFKHLVHINRRRRSTITISSTSSNKSTSTNTTTTTIIITTRKKTHLQLPSLNRSISKWIESNPNRLQFKYLPKVFPLLLLLSLWFLSTQGFTVKGFWFRGGVCLCYFGWKYGRISYK